jgi:uncharacterized membrane protein (UPF0127 family)
VIRLLAALLLVASCEDVPEVSIAAADGSEVLRVEVDLAITAAERMQGLRGRDLEAGTGLLFVLPGPPDSVCIANDGVDFAIDAVFIAEGAVTEVERAVAAGDASDRCHRADHILELRTGAAAGVTTGYSVHLP